MKKLFILAAILFSFNASACHVSDEDVEIMLSVLPVDTAKDLRSEFYNM